MYKLEYPSIAYGEDDLDIFDGKPQASQFFKLVMSADELGLMYQKVKDMENSTNPDGTPKFSRERISVGCFTESLRFAIFKKELEDLQSPIRVYLIPSKGPNEPDDGDFYFSLSGERDVWDYVWDEKSFTADKTDRCHRFQFYDFITHSVSNPYPKLNNWIIGNTVYFKNAEKIVAGPAIWGGYFMEHAVAGVWTQECAKNRRELKLGPHSWSTRAILRHFEKVRSDQPIAGSNLSP